MFIESHSVSGLRAIKDKVEVKQFAPINIICSNDNYSGKSSLMTSITLPLAGKKVLEKKLNLEDYVNDYSKNFEIEQIFKHTGLTYHNFYNYPKNKIDKRLIIKDQEGNQVDLIEGITNVEDYIAKHISDPELIANANIASQRSENDFLFQEKTKKLEIMRAILGLDTIEDAIKLCKDTIKDLNKNIEKVKTEITVLESQKLELKPVDDIPVDYDATINRYNELKTDYDKYLKSQDLTVKYDTQQSILKDKTDSLTVEKDKICSLNDDLKQIDEDLLQFNNLDNDIKEKTELINNLKEKLTRIKNDLIAYEIYETNNKELKLLKRNLAILTETINESEFKSIESIVSEIESKTKYLRDDRIELEKVQKEITNLEVKIKSEQEHIELIKLGKCPTCKQEVNGGQSGIESGQTKIDSWKERILECQGMEEELRKDISEWESEIKTLNDVKTNLSVSINKKENLEKEITEKESKLIKPDIDKDLLLIHQTQNLDDTGRIQLDLSKLTESKEKYDELKTSKIKKQSDLDNVVNNVTKLESEIKATNDLIEKLNIEKQSVQLGNFDIVEYNSISTKKQNYDLLMTERESIVKQNIEIQTQIDTRKTMLEEKRSQVQSSTEQIDTETRSVKLMQGYITSQINKGLRKLIIIMNDFISSVHETYEVKLENEDDIDIVYSINGGDKWKLTHSSSGFEKLTLQGAWKVALSKLQNLGILFLDEPDGAAVDKNSIKLLDAFVNQGFEQIFIITLNPDTIEYLTNNYGAKTFKMEKGRLVK